MNVRELEPALVWNHFEDLNKVPRPSKKEERVIQFILDFGASLNLDIYRDDIGNVIIKKPATQGMEQCKTVILQSHLDMVHQKNADTNFDFSSQGIESYIDGDWVKARGTTLGADNGIGVAAIMSILSSSEIAHPPIEALFTIDEETGMTGAFHLEENRLKGSILLNLDTEDDDEFSIGCAGGMDTNTRKFYAQEAVTSGIAFEIKVKGLKGGHSGVEIHLERGNANKIMNRILYKCENYGLRVALLDGGSLRNAIPRESSAIVVVNSSDFAEHIDQMRILLQNEFSTEDPGLQIEYTEIALPDQALSVTDSTELCTAVYGCHNGVFRMSRSIDGLVETSSSLARIILKDGEFITQSLQRSSVESGKWDVAYSVAAGFHLIKSDVEHTGAYPGWEPNPNSEILEIMKEKYESLFGEEPKVSAIHAGLECGIIGERYPGLDMISFGPTIKGPHSPDERVQIASVRKFWKFLLEILKAIPKA